MNEEKIHNEFCDILEVLTEGMIDNSTTIEILQEEIAELKQQIRNYKNEKWESKKTNTKSIW